MTDDVATVLTADLEDGIREIVGAYGGLAVNLDDLRDSDDLFRAGMTSQANVTVMLAIEESFNIEFPEAMLRRSTFESLSSISRAVLELLSERVALVSEEAAI